MRSDWEDARAITTASLRVKLLLLTTPVYSRTAVLSMQTTHQLTLSLSSWPASEETLCYDPTTNFPTIANQNRTKTPSNLIRHTQHSFANEPGPA